MTLLSDTAYHSFIGEVEALNTTTIRRLTRSRRHQLLVIARTVPANSSLTKRCPTASDQAGSLAARRISVKRSDMILVPT